ncbi:uncharacterized protein LOC107268077 isoform X1 [Cephus cinctus]|uniref:Uncharacterized protein LOC107268077 isoform X1 n=1 Tax=Cephus cinctus TaxID=211228 RepID=A0AAJ7FK89_CEPCN|nr:uncharacterized protein LOC107268077 isoform X1 [Cephus cinctus]
MTIDLEEYKRRVVEIKRQAYENDINEIEVEKIFDEVFEMLEARQASKSCNLIMMIKSLIFLVFALILGMISLYNHPSTHNILLRNLQNFIYPGMKVFRKLAVPIISNYPSLTEFYDEWCLVENSLFRVAEMDCWPCDSIRSVPDLTGHNITASFNPGIPYTRIENGNIVNLKELFKLYKNNKAIFDRDASRVLTNNDSFRTIEEVLTARNDLYPSKYKDVHVTWRINRMTPGRIIRKLFPKPVETPDWWSQSMEKFVFIDEPRSPAYTLPNPECSNIFMRCTNGARLLHMIPSPECIQQCKPSTIILPAHHTLWYNWWYWRPVSLPATNSTEISINYLTSFC